MNTALDPVSRLQSMEDASVDYLQRLLGARDAAIAQPVSHLVELESTLQDRASGAAAAFIPSRLPPRPRRLAVRRRPACDSTSPHGAR